MEISDALAKAKAKKRIFQRQIYVADSFGLTISLVLYALFRSLVFFQVIAIDYQGYIPMVTIAIFVAFALLLALIIHQTNLPLMNARYQKFYAELISDFMHGYPLIPHRGNWLVSGEENEFFKTVFALDIPHNVSAFATKDTESYYTVLTFASVKNMTILYTHTDQVTPFTLHYLSEEKSRSISGSHTHLVRFNAHQIALHKGASIQTTLREKELVDLLTIARKDSINQLRLHSLCPFTITFMNGYLVLILDGISLDLSIHLQDNLSQKRFAKQVEDRHHLDIYIQSLQQLMDLPS